MLPALAVVVVAFGGAIAGLVVTSLRPGGVVGGAVGLAAWRRVLADPAFHDALTFTLWVTVASTAVATGLAVVVAVVVRGAPGIVRVATIAAVPVPHLVVAALAVLWAGPGGLVDRVVEGWGDALVGDRRGMGIIVVYLVKEVPFLATLVLVAWDRATDDLAEAAAALGAGPVRRLRDVVVPRVAMPLGAGALVVAAFVIGATEVPLLVGPTVPDSLATHSLTVVRLDGPAARADAAAVLTVATAMALGAGAIALGVVDKRPVVRVGQRPVGLVAARAVVVVLAVAPFLVLPVRAFADVWRAPALWPQSLGLRGVRAVRNDPLLLDALATSTLVAVVTVASGLFLAWPAARAIARAERRPSVVVIVLGAPLLAPPLAVGNGLSTWLVRLGVDGSTGVVVAHLVVVVPYMVLALVSGWTPELAGRDDAAASLGASPLQRLWTVTVPGLRRALLLALALGFTVSWSQYGTTLGVGGGVVTLPVVLVPFVRADPQVAAVLELLLVVPPLVALGLAVRVPDHAIGGAPRSRSGASGPR